MLILEELYRGIPKLLPFLATAATVAVLLWLAHWLLLRRKQNLGLEDKTPRLIAMLVLAVGGLVCVVLALPMQSDTRGHVLSVIGLALTAIIALSSTTLVANAMAGLMLRMVRSFRPGDFVRVGAHFGRVTERGLFHTEIQTQDRDLTTLPNLYLVSNPLTVVRSSGTVVSASLSLGYDTSHSVIEPLLIRAAEATELQEPFVQIVDLGDFAVTYRVAGFLPETKHLLTVRSQLRRMVLDTLHGAGVEIVSPTFMNQRVLQHGERAMPETPASRQSGAAPVVSETPEDLIFDKADGAEKIEQLRKLHGELMQRIKDLESRGVEGDSDARVRAEYEVESIRRRAERIESALNAQQEENAKDD